MRQIDDHIRDAVMPHFRSRADLHRWGAANAYGDIANSGVDEFEALAGREDPAMLVKPVEKAIATTVRVVLRADDSSGRIGDAIRRLLVLHARLCRAAPPKTKTLVDWLIKFNFGGRQDFFETDIVDYAEALGTDGIALYEARLAEISACTPQIDEKQQDLLRSQRQGDSVEVLASPSSSSRHDRWLLERNAKRLAVVHRNVPLIVELYAGDQSRAYRMEDAARALVEIGEVERAIELAERGALMESGFQAESCALYWCAIVKEQRPDDAVAVCGRVFDAFSTEENATRLYGIAGSRWTEFEEPVLDALSKDPSQYVGFLLRGLGDVGRAWHEAELIGLDDLYLWVELVAEYQKVNPAAVVPFIKRLIDDDMRDAGVRNYRRAVKRLRQLRTVAAEAEMEGDFIDYVASLRAKHRNRPRFIEELDKAMLG